MKNQEVHRRKFLQLGGTLAAASIIGPTLYSNTLFSELESSTSTEEGKIRLFSNENPYGPSKKVLDVISNQLSRTNRYASYHKYSTDTLKESIAKKHGVEKNQVILGHGSFEILCMLTRAFGKQENSIIVPGYTFNVTGRFADKVFDHQCKQIPLNESMDIDLVATKKAITKDTQLVYICNPNNPTGKILSASELENFCKEIASSSCTIAIDEAYIDLVSPKDRLDIGKLLIEKHNVLIIRTFSKAYGLAGLRVGYAIGLPKVIERINSEHYSFGGLICNLGVAAAITALEDNAYTADYRNKNIEVRSYVEQSLQSFGIEYLPSTTNFMLLKVKDVDRYRKALKTVGISPVPGGGAKYPEWSRISIGTQPEMETFIKTIGKMDWLIKK
ncbi:pyridoxal phosphate-dependent aminotransferase [Aquimarina sp. 2304DJ70-9]|uniref:pyridoxal phosphate-dependent aminotransferase n=1 Tax=Aquimarina penaris TaxID=3231044 RepID=UPI003462F476